MLYGGQVPIRRDRLYHVVELEVQFQMGHLICIDKENLHFLFLLILKKKNSDFSFEFDRTILIVPILSTISIPSLTFLSVQIAFPAM